MHSANLHVKVRIYNAEHGPTVPVHQVRCQLNKVVGFRNIEAQIGGAAEPGQWPERPDVPGRPRPDPLPLDALPAVLRNCVNSVSAATQTPADMAGLLVLACVSVAVGGPVVIRVDARGWREPSVLYAVIILPPGSRKSPVYKRLTKPICIWERDERERIASAYRRAMDAVDVAEGALNKAKGEAAKGKGSLSEVAAQSDALEAAKAAVPILPRLIASDATPEALVRLMDSQGGRIALLAPEGDPLRIADGRYSNSSPRLGELKQAWSGEAITVDRIGRENIHIPHPALTLGLTMQPGVIDSLKNQASMRGEGLLGRILWCVPPHGLGERLTGRNVPALDTDATDRYGRMLVRLLDEFGGVDEPRERALSSNALGILHAYEGEIEGSRRSRMCGRSSRTWSTAGAFA